MKRYGVVFVILFANGIFTSVGHTQDQGAKAMEQLRSLVGEWQGKRPDGKSVRVTYEVMSAGNYVVERLRPADEPDMLTIYHLDGDKVMMTHYCAANNQPRMRMTRMNPDSKKIEFDYLDATNLPSPAAGHMRGLTLVLERPDRLVQEWTWQEGDKEVTNTFVLTRSK